MLGGHLGPQELDRPQVLQRLGVQADGRQALAGIFERDQRAVLLEAVEMCPGMKEVIMVLLPQFLGIEPVTDTLEHHELQHH